MEDRSAVAKGGNRTAACVVGSLLIILSGGHFGTGGGKRGANRNPFLLKIISRICKALRVSHPFLSSMFS
jgi:hypothetical protein